MFENVFEEIKKTIIVPVVKVTEPSVAVELVNALQQGGLNSIEITFRSTNGQEELDKIASCIKEVSVKCPQMLLGAGTVINSNLAKMAVNAGAKFIVSPGFNPDTVDWCVQNNVPVIPGINSPSQVELALAKNLTLLKFFPAEVSGGVKMLKALAGPFPQVKFMATGGVNEENISSYLACSNIAAIGGSWMVQEKLIKERNWNKIVELSKNAVSLITQSK